MKNLLFRNGIPQPVSHGVVHFFYLERFAVYDANKIGGVVDQQGKILQRLVLLHQSTLLPVQLQQHRYFGFGYFGIQRLCQVVDSAFFKSF